MKRGKAEKRGAPAAAEPIRAGSPGLQGRESLLPLLAATAGVVLLVALVYLPVLDCRAISYDDMEYLHENWLVLKPDLDSVVRFFSEVTAPSTVRGYYQPLTMVSLMLDVAAGAGPDNLRPFRVTSLVLHLANTALIIVVLYQLFRNVAGAAIAALLFGLHPLTVEPVAWTADRKTVLAMFFALLCFIAYVRYVRTRDAAADVPQARRMPARAWLLLALALLCYVLALLAKPTVTPIAVLLLVLDWWPLRRLGARVLLEKLPFFVIACISGVITYVSQASTASATTPDPAAAGRFILIICHDIIFYLEKLLIPVGLTPHYPVPNPLSLANPRVLAAVFGTAGLVTVILVSTRRTRAVAAGAMFFFLAILPTMGIIGFTQVLTCDKYVYFPVLGVLMAVAPGVAWLWRDRRKRPVILAAVAGLAGAEAIGLRATLRHWRDSETLALQMLKVTPELAQPYVMLGAARLERGDVDGAIESYHRSLSIDPTHHPAHYGLAWVLASRGRDAEAIQHYEAALRSAPSNVSSRNNLANLLARHGRYAEALDHYAFVLALRPSSAQAHYNLAGVLLALGRLDEAEEHLRITVQLRPDRADVLNNLGMAMAGRGDIEAALGVYAQAIALEPNDAVTYYNMANALASAGRHEEAVRRYGDAIRLRADYTSAHNNMANSLRQLGRRDAAIAAFQEALRIDPNHARARANLADVLAELGHWQEAAAQYEQSLRVRSTPRGQYRYGLALVQLGRRDEAVAAFQEALRLDPQLADARRELEKLGQTSATAPQ